MDLKALRYFEFVAELKSFSKAAVHLRVEQPALSRQMRKLEEELGVELVTRHGRGVEMTEAGEILLRGTKRLSREIAQIVEEVRSRGNEMRGPVLIGVPPTIGHFLIPQLMVEAKSQFPNLTLEIVESASPGLSRRLLTDEVSLAILHNPEPHRDLFIIPVVRDFLYVIGPSSEINGFKPVVPGQPLNGLPMILPRRPHNRRLIIERFCVAHGIELDVRHQVDGFTIIGSMVEQGLGYSILSYYGVQELIAAGRISATQVTNPQIPWELCIAYRRDLRSFKPVEVIVNLLVLRLREYIREGIWWPNAQYLISTDP